MMRIRSLRALRQARDKLREAIFTVPEKEFASFLIQGTMHANLLRARRKFIMGRGQGCF